jgi:hypothetical protein
LVPTPLTGFGAEGRGAPPPVTGRGAIPGREGGGAGFAALGREIGGAGRFAAGPTTVASSCRDSASVIGGESLGAVARTSVARISIVCPHLRHFIRRVFPCTFSSAIWYFALHWSQRNFIAFDPAVGLPVLSERPGVSMAKVDRDVVDEPSCSRGFAVVSAAARDQVEVTAVSASAP